MGFGLTYGGRAVPASVPGTLAYSVFKERQPASKGRTIFIVAIRLMRAGPAADYVPTHVSWPLAGWPIHSGGETDYTRGWRTHERAYG
jgi:hypothetical protein